LLLGYKEALSTLATVVAFAGVYIVAEIGNYSRQCGQDSTATGVG